MVDEDCQKINKLLSEITDWMESATKEQAIEYQEKLKMLIIKFT